MLRFLNSEDSRFDDEEKVNVSSSNTTGTEDQDQYLTELETHYYQQEVIASESNRPTTYMKSTISSDDSAIFGQSGKLADVNIESETKLIDDSLCPEKNYRSCYW